MGDCGHLFRLEAVKGGSERWRCVACGEERIDGPASRCGRCGGYLCEDRPWWCQNFEGHARPTPEERSEPGDRSERGEPWAGT